MMAGEFDLTPDPRISNMRPAWLTDDEQWRDQLQSLPYDDAMWFERHWKMADGAPPTLRPPVGQDGEHRWKKIAIWRGVKAALGVR